MLSLCYLYVILMLFLCYFYVIFMLFLCYPYVILMLSHYYIFFNELVIYYDISGTPPAGIGFVRPYTTLNPLVGSEVHL